MDPRERQIRMNAVAPPREPIHMNPNYRTPIQSGGPRGEFGGSQQLYTGRNPFITPNDPGMDFGAPSRYGPPRGRPTMPDMGPGRRPDDPGPIFPNPRRPGIGRPAPEWPYNPRPPGRRPGGGGRPPGGVGPRSPWDREYRPNRPVPMSSGDYLAENFGGGLGSLQNESANGMAEEAGISPHDWRTLWKLQQMGIDPTPHIESVKYGPNPFPGPLDGGLPPTSPGPFYPGGPGEGWDIAERSSDFGSDWRGQQMLYDRIIQANPGLGEDELMILFQQAMDQATA